MLELVDEHGVLLRRDVVASGYDDKALQRLLEMNVLVRIRQGAYARAEHWAAWSPAQRHRCRARAVMRQYAEGTVALSHGSAVQLYGGPDWRLDLDAVHVTSLFGTGGRRSAGVVHHKGSCGVQDLTRRGSGLWVTAPARTVLDTASIVGLDAGVVVADWFLYHGLTSKEELRLHSARMDVWPNTLRHRRVVQLSSPLRESIGETLSCMLFMKERLPFPELQWEVRHPDGRLAGRTDFAWPAHRAFGEFDGKVKYHRYRRPGESIEEAVMREKEREDLLRELTGFRMIRLTWPDLAAPRRTAERIRRMLGQVAA